MNLAMKMKESMPETVCHICVSSQSVMTHACECASYGYLEKQDGV